MSLFEYLAIAFSLVFSFAAMRLVSGLPHALDSGRRYWVHLVLVFLQLLAITGVFWIFWSYRDVEWSFPRFLLALASPAILYFNACTLIPEAPASVESWRAYYFSTRKRYFVAVCFWALAVGAASSVILRMPLTHPARALQGVAFALGVLGAASANPRVHAAIAACLLGLSLLAMFVVASRPGAFAH